MAPFDIALICILTLAGGWAIIFFIGLCLSAMKYMFRLIKEMMED
jgi:hypothetical protein